MKLYRVTCRGMTSSIGSNAVHGIAYVVSDNAEEAYQKLRKHLDKEDLGFSNERTLESIELIAEEGKYPDTLFKLFI